MVQFNKIENTKIYSKLDWVCKDQTDYKDDGCKYYDTFNNWLPVKIKTFTSNVCKSRESSSTIYNK